MMAVRALVAITACLVLATPVEAAKSWTERYVDCANGNDGSDGTSEANAWLTVQFAADTATSGMRVNIEWDDSSFDCTLSATIDMDTNSGTVDDPILFQGYTTTPGDGGVAVIDGDSTAGNIFQMNSADFIIFRHIEVKGGTIDGWNIGNGSDNIAWIEIKITDAGSIGIDVASGSQRCRQIGNEITGTTGVGIEQGDERTVMAYNYIHDTSGTGIVVVIGATIVANVIDTTTGHNVSILGDFGLIAGNTLYNATGAGNDNINITSSDEWHVITNNIMNTAADFNLDINSGNAILAYGFNNPDDGVSGTIHDDTLIQVDLGGAQDDVDPQFTDAAGQDFSIGTNLDDLGYPATYLGSSTTSHVEIGASMHEETAGGGGAGGWGF